MADFTLPGEYQHSTIKNIISTCFGHEKFLLMMGPEKACYLKSKNCSILVNDAVSHSSEFKAME